MSLSLSVINGTSWFNGNSNADLKFLNISCGNQTREYQWINDSIFSNNYSCNEIGYITNKVLTPGEHHLEFKFGNDIGNANNLAFFPSTSDSVALGDKVMPNISPKDTISISESATISNRVVADAISLQERGLPTFSTKDTIALSESVTLSRPIFVFDEIAISESTNFVQNRFHPIVVSDGIIIHEFATISSANLSISSSGSSSDNTPPILISNDSAFMINNDVISFDNSQQKTKVETGSPVSFTIKLEDNSGPQNIQHVELYFDQLEQIIKNDLSETGIIFDRYSDLKILDPKDSIQDASVTISQEKTFVIFRFEVIFSGEIKSSDILIRAWDIDRNLLTLYAHDVLSVILADTSKQESIVSESNESSLEKNLLYSKIQPVSFLDAFDKWAGFSEQSISDTGFLSHIGIDGNIIPNWFKDNNAKWFKQKLISQDDLIIALNNLKNRGIIE